MIIATGVIFWYSLDMNEPTEQNNQPCLNCGYPAHAGHTSDCPLSNKEAESETPYSVGYSLVPKQLKKFIIPHAAEGPNIHELYTKIDFKMPVSFHIEGNDFYITGVQSENNTGAIIWGNISGDEVKIKHIEIAKNLKNKGIGRALLADLEDQLKKQGVKTAYATFGKTRTVEFFIKNGYKIVPIESLTVEERARLDVDTADFDTRVDNEDSFRELKANEGIEFKKITEEYLSL
mgnify:FL=1